MEEERIDDVFSIHRPKEKNSFQKIKLNGITFSMQVDTGSEVTLIPRNFSKQTGKSKLKNKSSKNEAIGCFI